MCGETVSRLTVTGQFNHDGRPAGRPKNAVGTQGSVGSTATRKTPVAGAGSGGGSGGGGRRPTTTRSALSWKCGKKIYWPMDTKFDVRRPQPARQEGGAVKQTRRRDTVSSPICVT